MGVSELRDPNIVITLNSRILMIRDPKPRYRYFLELSNGLRVCMARGDVFFILPVPRSLSLSLVSSTLWSLL